MMFEAIALAFVILGRGINEEIAWLRYIAQLI
jgi:hypothetical protein